LNQLLRFYTEHFTRSLSFNSNVFSCQLVTVFRVDYNVPLKDGVITNNHRIRATLDTVKYALDKKAKSVVLMAHMSRPNGQKNLKYSLKPVAVELQKLLGRFVSCYLS